MASTVLDASAVLAVLLGERGADAVLPYLTSGCISAVNYSEVLARTARLCGEFDEAKRRVERLNLDVIPFDANHAAIVASLVPSTQPLNISMADRACLALGLARGEKVVTGDRKRTELDCGVIVECFR